jgi:hypothetical protein
VRIVFWHSDKPRERLLADAFADGARVHGDTVELRPLESGPVSPADADVVCMVGVKSRELYRVHQREGIHVVYFDKGYTRHAAPTPVKLWEYWRVSVDRHHPTEMLMDIARPMDRADRLGLVMQRWRKPTKRGHVLIAGSSAKYHQFYGLKAPTPYAHKLVAALREHTARPITYRPKPSWKDAEPIEGTEYSGTDQTIEQALAGAHCLVTHGSNAVFEAVLLGIPCVVLGDAVARPISSTSVADVEAPYLATYEQRHQWLANLAYWQWTMPELHRGEAWQYLRPLIYR